MALTDYSTTPANNNSAPPNGAPEGMAAASVNDTMRQIMADVKGGVSFTVATKSIMSALDSAKLSEGNLVLMSARTTVGDNGGGILRVTKTDISTNVTSDPGQGFYIPFDSDVTGASGGFIRDNTGDSLAEWFGLVADGVTDDRIAIENAISASPGRVLLPAKTISIKSNLTFSKSHTYLRGSGFQSTLGSPVTTLLIDDGITILTPDTNPIVTARHITIENFRIERVSGSTSTTPVLQILSSPDFILRSMFISPSDATNGVAVKIRWSWNCLLEDVWLWTAKYLLDGDDAANAIRLEHCNFNGMQYGVVGGYNTIKIVRCTIQQYTIAAIMLGKNYESVVPESSTAPTIKDNYFETGTGAARSIDLGEDTWVRNPIITGNYFAHVGNLGLQPPIKLKRVYGFDISNNFYTGLTTKILSEWEYYATGGIHFPSNGIMQYNNDLFTPDPGLQMMWFTGTTELQKFSIFKDDSVTIKDWDKPNIGQTTIVRSSPLSLNIAGVSTIAIPIMRGEHYGEISSIKILCSDNIAATTLLTVEVGVPSLPSFYGSVAQSSFNSDTITDMTLANTRIHNDNRLITAKITETGGLTISGSVSIEVYYHSVIE